MKLLTPFTLAISALFLVSCDRHEWDETKKLFPAKEHHAAEGHEAHGTAEDSHAHDAAEKHDHEEHKEEAPH